jgi:hypothetical protein
VAGRIHHVDRCQADLYLYLDVLADGRERGDRVYQCLLTHQPVKSLKCPAPPTTPRFAEVLGSHRGARQALGIKEPPFPRQ